MFDYDSPSLDGDFGRSELNDPFAKFRSENHTPTTRLVWEITDVAVKGVSHPISRKRVMNLVASKMAAGVSFLEPPPKPKRSLAESAWSHFAASKLNSPPKFIMIVGRSGTGKTAHLELFTRQSEKSADSQTFEHVEELSTTPDEILGEEPGEAKTTFVPSSELIGAWLNGLNALRIEGKHDPFPSVTNETISQYSFELSRQLRKVISNFAKRKAYEGGRYRITLGQRFYPTIETLIEDHLMLPPRNAVEFLDIFKDELFAQSANGPVFSGRWGELLVDDASELVLDLHKRRARKLSIILKGK